MKISAILYGFFFAIAYSVVDKPRSNILMFAGILIALVAAEKIAENAYVQADIVDNRLPLAKAIICYAAFIILRLLGFDGIYKPAFDIFMTLVFAIIPAVLVYFIVRYQVKRQRP